MPDNYDVAARLQETFEEAVKAFADWAAKNWTMTPQEAATLTEPSAAPAEYARGYTDAMSSIPDAVSLWLDEYWG